MLITSQETNQKSEESVESVVLKRWIRTCADIINRESKTYVLLLQYFLFFLFTSDYQQAILSSNYNISTKVKLFLFYSIFSTFSWNTDCAISSKKNNFMACIKSYQALSA
jgi:hypothetical protein